MQASPDLRSAQAQLREARARRVVAAAGQYPSVTASGSASRSQSSEEIGSGDTRNFFSAGFDASWELDVFGGVRRSVEAAEADLASTEASLENTRVSLASEVALNYIEVRTRQVLLGIARDNLASQSETLQLTDWRAQAGLGQQPGRRAGAQQPRADPGADSCTRNQPGRSGTYAGHPAGQGRRARCMRAWPQPAICRRCPMQIAVGIPADTLRQRPDVRAAERRLAAETARVGVAEAARYPSFNLSGSIGLEALTFGALGNSDAVASSLFAGITGPIFDAGRLRAQVEIQDAVREQALVAYEQTVLVALQDVENALVALARNRERVEALAKRR